MSGDEVVYSEVATRLRLLLDLLWRCDIRRTVMIRSRVRSTLRS
jgi:hypothetical protein